MNEIYIRNKSNKNLYLKFNQETGPVTEIDVSTKPIFPYGKACYVAIPNGFIGAISSKTGPYLFINNEKFDFLDMSWSVKVNKGKQWNTFHILKDGVEILSEEYRSPQIDDCDPWSDEESEDFFIWLEAKRNDKELMEMWTI